MKKVFLSMLALICSLSLMATQTAYVQIDLVGTTYPAFSTASLYLMEDTERSAAYESGYDSQDAGTLSNNYSVLLYGLVGATKCSNVATDDLTGLYIGFTTNNVDTEYKLVFSDFEGDEFTLYDLVANQAILVNASTPDYEFTATSGQVEINDRFVINYVAPVPSVTTNADGWASFSWNANLEPDDSSLKIYRGAYNNNPANPEIALYEFSGYVPSNQGVFVYGVPGTTYTFHAYSGIMVGGLTNDIVACVDATPVSNFAGQDIYTLRYANGETALWHYTGTDDIPAHKAVLPISLGGAPAPRRISFHFEETQAIENVEIAAPAEKFIENGQVFIKRGEAIYNLQGQMVK